ncbi:RNA polymerase sigma factor [Frigoriflavimonas asaccharolytica]|uniref:RNA polymerase sigma factor n=1 Tax=Frigoriflavimonas asaccharolytica TaxID=2735899 RepID=A0A8J8K406_9FLAO|nr:RNA polymerase sigma factor [Frigoriflavimonas asaccharolytica]NRS91200.1 RNA polymerase sigma-70 factor (ECF subfamily) [Frigoriflavimonas asaccharolytica]
MKEIDEEILALMLHKRGHEKGLRLMMDTYQSRLYWHIKRLMDDHALAQDVLQDTFIKAYQNIEKFKKESQLYTWLYRIATNESLQQLNKMKKLQKADENAEYHLMNLVAETNESDSIEILEILEKAIQTLPEKQKLVFMMRYYDELSYEDISQIVDMSVGTLKTNYHYAKQKIEEYIKTNHQD